MTSASILRLLACGLLISVTASAQTQVGQVTLTPASAPPKPATASSKAPSPTFQVARPPAGWYNLTGRVTAPNSPSLPSGSQIIVTLQNLKAGSSPLVQVKFPSSRLNVPYQMYFNVSRLKSGESYGLKATVQDKKGKVIYRSPNPAPLPGTSTGSINLSVVSIP